MSLKNYQKNFILFKKGREMETLKKCFGSRIKEIRESRNISQEALAELVNMESRHISRIETGKSFTTLENIAKIASALKTDISELFLFEHKKDKEFLVREINDYLDSATSGQIELIYKLIKNIII